MTTNDDDLLAVLDSVDDVDELYSNLLYAAPAHVLTPDQRSWKVWVFSNDETLQIRHLDEPCANGWQHEPTSFEDAYRYLRGGVARRLDSLD